MKETDIKVVLEHVYEGSPGEGYEAGVETANGNRTEKGWYAKSPEVALMRFILDKALMTQNLANAVADDVQVLAALTQALADKCGWKLDEHMRPDYALRKEFGLSRIEKVEAERDRLAKELDGLCRCEHGRRYKETCCECPGGVSVGGVYNGAVATTTAAGRGEE